MKEHILVVDDSKQNRMVAVGHLEAGGYRVTSVDSGEDALAVLGKESVDLVVLDVLMPGIGGYETCRRIRATPAIADVPVLFLTALGDRGTMQPAVEAGGDDLLGKPFDHVELQLRVRSLIRLRRQQKQLAEQNTALRRISQMIVHDLRGPTNAITINSEMLQEARLPGELGDVIDDITTSARHINATVNDLLDLSRAEDVGVEAKLDAFELPTLVAEIASALRGIGRWKGVSIVADVRVRELVGDRELIRRMLQNLVHNALKHAPSDSEVVVQAVIEGDDVMLRVLDRGRGIPIEDAERIFERYVSSGSHGLGLAFCRLVAEAHGGRIWVEGRVPNGSAFCVRLPRQTAGAVTHTKRPPTAG